MGERLYRKALQVALLRSSCSVNNRFLAGRIRQTDASLFIWAWWALAPCSIVDCAGISLKRFAGVFGAGSLSWN